MARDVFCSGSGRSVSMTTLMFLFALVWPQLSAEVCALKFGLREHDKETAHERLHDLSGGAVVTPQIMREQMQREEEKRQRQNQIHNDRLRQQLSRSGHDARCDQGQQGQGAPLWFDPLRAPEEQLGNIHPLLQDGEEQEEAAGGAARRCFQSWCVTS